MWSAVEFGASQRGLIHGRSIKSLAKAGFMLAERVGQSFSSVLGNSFRQDVAAIFAKEHMEASSILHGHVQATVERAKSSASQVIIVPQDTVFYNYSGHKAKEGLTAIQQQTKGLVQHNVLALDKDGLPLGLLWQHNWARKGKNAGLFEKESDKWFKGLEAVNAQATAIGKRIVLVQDRESDILAFFKAHRAEQVELLVRVCQNRTLQDTDSEETFKLNQAKENLREAGTMQVKIIRKNKEVKLTLQLKAGQVSVWPGKDKSVALHKTKPMTLVSALEIAAVDEKGNNCHDPEAAADWLLLTTLPLDDTCTAANIVRYYSLRWRIERFHYVNKTGALNVEELRFDDVHTLINALAFYSVLAWRILHLTYLVRNEPQASAETCFNETEISVLSSYSRTKVQTVEQAIKVLGKLVGFQPSKKYPLPGAKKLGQAIERLNAMVEGYKLAQI
jgi:dsDNA-binding SOS-regulon protein